MKPCVFFRKVHNTWLFLKPCMCKKYNYNVNSRIKCIIVEEEKGQKIICTGPRRDIDSTITRNNGKER